MSRGVKRQRTGVSSFVVPKRPIDKGLVNVIQGISTTQDATVLITATFPCTITGLRWEIGLIGGPLATAVRWAIIIVRDGNIAGTIGASDAGDFYTPEQDVMAFGCVFLEDTDVGSSAFVVSGSTKSMRKLMGGDQIMFIHSASQSNGTLNGVVQLFCKS